MSGRTGVCIFEGIMDADGYVSILEQALLPFLRDVYQDGHGIALFKIMTQNIPQSVALHFSARTG